MDLPVLLAGLVALATTFYFMVQYFKGGVCTSKKSLKGKTVVITGCNTGIGRETALDMSRRGARVVMACRNLDLANKAAADLKRETSGAFEVYKLDLASQKSIRQCAKEINEKEKQIDILINNAGIMMCPLMRTEDGFEMQTGTNHFGHFLFTNLLLDKIKASAPGARIVTLSSLAHESGKIDLDDINFEKRKYNTLTAYQQSKLANIHFTRELSKRLKGTGVNTYCLHPGVVRTELARHVEDLIGPLKHVMWPLLYPFSKSPVEGAQTSIYCAVDDGCANETGKATEI